jgi:hypothetical protein
MRLLGEPASHPTVSSQLSQKGRQSHLTPRMETSTWPPLIMAKDSELSKVAAPGTRVTVSFPALTMSLIGCQGLFGLYSRDTGDATHGSTSSGSG